MRAFFGIPLDEGLRDRLVEAQADLRSAGADVLWVKPESLHLTLKFLGDVGEDFRADLGELKAFDLELFGIGEFSGRVVWAGCRGDMESLRGAAAHLEAAAERAGVPRERRPLEPHVTIGRMKSTRRLQDLRGRMAAWRDRVFGPWPVRRVVLFRSETSPRGSVYKVVAEYPCIAR
ncbi:MAG TPA: RNA 2',3'-cyclic phosphodiesterase [Planctomycetota bacterium]|nr:RNA 2',3'-cyclic phosphodiesterase [Planctomycetota bacterium]